MKANKLVKLSISLLGLMVVISSVSLHQQYGKDNTLVQAWSGTQTSNEGSYYSSITTETGSALKAKLKTLISSGTSESYDWSRYEAADEAQGDSTRVLLIYSRQNVLKTAHVSGSVGWNREHSFAKSLFGDAAPAVNDNHHIFADDNKTNGHRGNKPFNELNPSTATRSIDSYGNTTDNYYTSSYFMPNDLAKGEVARSTMYMNTRYDYSVTLNFYSVELMLKWHLENPVTDREIYRNNTVHSLQKNRNPYIDHQNWACSVYGSTNSATQTLCDSYSNSEPISLSVTPSSGTILVGNTINLTASVLPSNATQSVTWSSANTSIATVSSSGVVTGVGVGQTTIQATSAEKSSVFGTATITVSNTSIPVTGISINQSSVSLAKGSTTTLTSTISPSNATNKNVTWSSSNTSFATVSTTGVVTGVGVGSGTITATSTDGGYTSSVPFDIYTNVEPTTNLEYSFGSSGNSSWPTTTGFGSYFGSGYGISTAGSGGTLKSSDILTNVPVGSQLTLTISAATNSSSNNATISIYGLDSSGTRISGISGSYVTPSKSGSDFNDMKAYAIANPGAIILSASMTKKIYALELVVGTSSSRTLLAQVDVAVTENSEANQALAFANFVNDDGGVGAAGNCEEVYSKLVTQYNLLSSDAQDYFIDQESSMFASAKERLNYLAAYTGSSDVYYASSNTSISINILMLSVISLISGLAITMYFYSKKKLL